MGIVRFALKYPHTFYVLAGLMLFLGGSAIVVAPKDIFPAINIPVVTVIWQYTGLTPEEMEQRVTTYSEYSISSSVNDIRTSKARPCPASSVEKIYFQPNVNVDLAIAQIVSASNSIRALMPPGIQPPIIVQYNASSVPVLQLSLSSDKLNEQQLYDYGIYQVRQQLAPIPGHHAADAVWRQIPPDHGRSRSGRAARAGHHAGRRGQRGECAEPDAAIRRRQDGRPAVHRAGQRHARNRSRR